MVREPLRHGARRQADRGRRIRSARTRQADHRQADRGRNLGIPAGGSRQAEPGRRNRQADPAGGSAGGTRQAEPGRRNAAAGGTRQAEPGRRNPAGGPGRRRQAEPGRRIAAGGLCPGGSAPRPTAHGPRSTAPDPRHTFQEPVGRHPGASLTWTQAGVTPSSRQSSGLRAGGRAAGAAGRQAGRQAGKKRPAENDSRRAGRCCALALNGEQIDGGTHRPRLELPARTFAQQIRRDVKRRAPVLDRRVIRRPSHRVKRLPTAYPARTPCHGRD
jgi:hypothetical protein